MVGLFGTRPRGNPGNQENNAAEVFLLVSWLPAFHKRPATPLGMQATIRGCCCGGYLAAGRIAPGGEIRSGAEGCPGRDPTYVWGLLRALARGTSGGVEDDVRHLHFEVVTQGMVDGTIFLVR